MLVKYSAELKEMWKKVRESGEEKSELLFHDEALVESVSSGKNEWYDAIGENTAVEKGIPVLNLQNCLMNEQETFGNIRSNYFEFVGDLGLRNCSYGNAGYGKNAYSGLYRTMEIARNGSTEFISLRLWGVAPGYNSLCVGHDSKKLKLSHHALQYQIDRFFQIEDNSCRFVHDGTMSRLKKRDLWRYAGKYAPHLLSGDEFFLGTLKYDELYHLSSDEMTNFITRLVEYALIRDDFRKYKKENKVISAK